MEENLAQTSISGKAEYFRRFILLGRIAEVYAEERKMLKQLIKQLKRERDGLKKTCFPMTDADKRDISLAICELSDIVRALLRPAEIERYKIALETLGEYIKKLQKVVGAPVAERVQTRTSAAAEAEKAIYGQGALKKTA